MAGCRPVHASSRPPMPWARPQARTEPPRPGSCPPRPDSRTGPRRRRKTSPGDGRRPPRTPSELQPERPGRRCPRSPRCPGESSGPELLRSWRARVDRQAGPASDRSAAGRGPGVGLPQTRHPHASFARDRGPRSGRRSTPAPGRCRSDRPGPGMDRLPSPLTMPDRSRPQQGRTTSESRVGHTLVGWRFDGFGGGHKMDGCPSSNGEAWPVLQLWLPPS